MRELEREPVGVDAGMTLTQQILARDGYVCQYCGDRACQRDHMFSAALQPDSIERDDLAFQVAACAKCNTAKGTLPFCPPSWAPKIPELNAYTPSHYWQTYSGKASELRVKGTKPVEEAA